MRFPDLNSGVGSPRRGDRGRLGVPSLPSPPQVCGGEGNGIAQLTSWTNRVSSDSRAGRARPPEKRASLVLCWPPPSHPPLAFSLKPLAFSPAFTLIEVVISAAIGAMILTAAALCLNASIASQKIIDPRVDTMQSARVALALMSADLRAACPLDTRYAFLGSHQMIGKIVSDNIDFATHHYTPRHPREGDFCEMSYFLDRESATGKLGLWRRRNPTLAPDPISGGSREEIVTGVGGLSMEYYDGLDWYDTWGDITGRKQANSDIEHPNLDGMPQAVRITLSFDSGAKTNLEEQADRSTNEPPLVFQTVVYLELAAISTSANSSSAAPAGTNSAAGSPGPNL
jgi:type II secretory pathway pseudopilin PulG